MGVDVWVRHQPNRPPNGREAVQWTYFGYLAAIKEQDGAAMSFGRIDAFFDVFFERDLERGDVTEQGIQEIVDHFVMKLRLVRHLRTPEYNMLFAGDPTWVTAVLGGVDSRGQPMVNKTSFRILRTLTKPRYEQASIALSPWKDEAETARAGWIMVISMAMEAIRHCRRCGFGAGRSTSNAVD